MCAIAEIGRRAACQYVLARMESVQALECGEIHCTLAQEDNGPGLAKCSAVRLG
jgi:hypothetical protein